MPGLVDQGKDCSDLAGVSPGRLSALLKELVRGTAEPVAGWDTALHAGVTIGRFELVRQVGQGGFGVVWEARDRELGRRVAFKAVRAGARREPREERLLLEAEAAARLAHPNIVALHDVGRTEHGPYLILELLLGKTLAERLRHGALPVPEAVRIGVEISKGVAHAHGKGVVHRDLKPENVFLSEDGQVKVLDFGLAHAFGHRKVEGGTSGYMAPEQAEGGPEDERTDVWALGAVLFEMLAGRQPFPDGKRTREAPALEVPGAPALGQVVGRMLAPRPADRPRDGGEVLEALESIKTELERAGPSAGRIRVRRRPKLAVAAMALAGVAAGVTVGFGLPRLYRDHGSKAWAMRSIAVLPFADMSPQKDQEYFSDGIAEEILNALSRVETLKVTGRTSSFFFKGKNEDLPTIGRKLGVDTVLEGSVRKAGDRVRVTAELVSVSDGYRLWSESFDRRLTDVLAVEDEIAAAVAGALKARLRTGRVGPMRTVDSEVHNQVLLGMQFLHRNTVPDSRRAKAAFERALELDPSYAPAWAKLALATFWVTGSADTFAGLRQGYERAEEAADKAVALDPDLAESYAVRGFLRESVRWDWSRARQDVERALALNPNDGEVYCIYATVLGTMGSPDASLVAARKATELDPLSASAWSTLGWILYSVAGQPDQALAALDRSLEIAPEQDFASALKAHVFLAQGRPADALAAAERSTAEWQRLELKSAAHYRLGQAQLSQQELQQLIAGYAHSAAFQIAEAYALRGNSDRAFEWLERAYTQHDSGMPFIKAMAPAFRGLRGDPRYGALLRRMGLPGED